MDNITSILNSFESGLFYRNREYSTILYGGTQTQLNDILKWVGTNLTPGFLNEIQYLDANAISECIKVADCLRKEFTYLISILKDKPIKSGTEDKLCDTFGNLAISDNRNGSCGFWRDLQAHEHIEVALSKHFKMEKQSRPAHLNVQNYISSNESVAENSSTTKISQNSAALILSEANCVKEANHLPCSVCHCNKSDNFKFNFVVDYNPMLKTLLYGRTFAEEVEVECTKQSAVQFRDGDRFACLLCNIQGFVSKRNVKEHINGHRHQKNKSLQARALSIYHKNWIQMEFAFQAHQLHFFPADNYVTLCSVCYTYVPYDKLELHIRNEQHMAGVLKLYRKNTRSTLLEIQASVYLPELILPENMEIRSKQRLTANLDKEKTDSDDSDDENANSVSDSKQKYVTHDIVLSIQNSSGTSLSDALEHRFWPHLIYIQEVPNNPTVQCTCCKILVPNQTAAIKEHLYSMDHISKCSLPNIRWRFYCEICDFHCARNNTWSQHYQSPKHIELCNGLGVARKSGLSEYECQTCYTIIFGDSLSLKRHSKGQKNKNKVLALSIPVRETFKTEKCIQDETDKLVAAANMVLSNPETMIECCKALEKALSEEFKNCKVYPFGSRVSGLGNEKSDLDVFVDVGDMYLGSKNQDSQTQEKFVKTACKVFRKKKDEFSHLNPIPTARTPIIQIFHKTTNIDCDLSFRHGLSVENSKFLRFCIQVQPVTQSLVLLLKKWIFQCKLHENLTTYALAMLVIYFLQVKSYLLPVQELKLLNIDNIVIIDGWSIVDFSTLHNEVQSRIANCDKSIKQLLIEFFNLYKDFDYTNDVVCPLLGRPVKKSLFLNPDANEGLPLEMLPYIQKLTNPFAEAFRAKSHFCIQDPFDLSHNLAKACCLGAVTKLKAYCDLSSKYLTSIQ